MMNCWIGEGIAMLGLLKRQGDVQGREISTLKEQLDTIQKRDCEQCAEHRITLTSEKEVCIFHMLMLNKASSILPLAEPKGRCFVAWQDKKRVNDQLDASRGEVHRLRQQLEALRQEAGSKRSEKESHLAEEALRCQQESLSLGSRLKKAEEKLSSSQAGESKAIKVAKTTQDEASSLARQLESTLQKCRLQSQTVNELRQELRSMEKRHQSHAGDLTGHERARQADRTEKEVMEGEIRTLKVHFYWRTFIYYCNLHVFHAKMLEKL